MLTLHEKGNKQVATFTGVGKRKRTNVFWHERIDKSLMNSVEDVQVFNTEDVRDELEISKPQADALFEHLEKETTPVTLVQKFFRLKRLVTERLLTEMDMGTESETFQIDFPDGKGFVGHHMIVGATSSGKTYFAMQKILRNLKGPEKNRRRFLIVSAQYFKDKTLEPLRQKKYEKYVDGIDAGEDGLVDSQSANAEEFFESEIKLRAENAPPGTVVLLDDFRDTVCSEQLRKWVNRGLRVLRHKDISLMIILHSIRSGAYSSQAHNSVKYMTVFPRSQRGKITAYLNTDLGVRYREAESIVKRFAQSGRHMTISLHAPEIFVGPKLLKLF
jgi:hypothetical protein